MRAVDTDVLVRLFVVDDPVQVESAGRIFTAGRVFLPKTVLVEFEWVVRTAYKFTPARVARAFVALIETADVEIEDREAVALAVDWYAAGLDFADALHLASSQGATAFLTFDAAMRRRAARLGTVPKVEAP